MMDSNTLAEIQHDQRTTERTEQYGARLDIETERVIEEMMEGKHDDEVSDGMFTDTGIMAKIARQVGLGMDIDPGLVRDMQAQLEALAQDIAERNMLDW
jgi:hypothetical protein